MKRFLITFNILSLLVLSLFLTGCVKEEDNGLTCDNSTALELLKEKRSKEFFDYINKRSKVFNGNYNIEYEDIIINEAYNPGTKKISCNAQEKIYNFSWDYSDAHLNCNVNYSIQETTDKKLIIKSERTEYYWYTGPCHAYDRNGNKISDDDIFYWSKK